MNNREHDPTQTDRQARIERLARQLSEAEHALQNLLAGEVDAVVDPVRGTPILLRQTQAELRRSEARTRLLLERVPALVWTTDADLCVTSIAGRELGMVSQAIGMPVDQAADHSLVDLAEERPELAGVLAAHYRALEGQEASYDTTVGDRVFHGSVEPLRDEEGRVVGCVGLGLDVTRRRRVGDPFGGQLESARARLETLVERSHALAPEHRALVREVLESSFVAIEELRVTGEELSQQNQELTSVYNDLEASRRQYLDLFESAPDGYLVTDPVGLIRRANQAAVDLLGVAENLMRDKPLVVYVAEGDRAEFHRRLDRVRAGEKVGGEWEVRMRNRARERPTEAVFPAAMTVSPIHDAQGRLTGLRWLVRDVSASKRAEERERLLEEARVAAEEAQAANALLRTLLDTMPAGVVVCDGAGAVLMTNAPGEKILGGRVRGAIEAPRRSYTPHYPDGAPFPSGEMPLVRAMELGETVSGVEILIRREDGPERTILAGAAPVRDRMGEVVSGVTVFQDITGRKRLEMALKAERARLHAIIESAPEGIVVADDEARILMTNPAAEALYARPVPYGEDYASHESLALCTPDGSPCDPRDLPLTRAALDGEVVHEEELAILWPDGQRRDLSVNAAPVWGSDRSVLGAVALFQDITERKRAAAERERLLAERTAVMEGMADGLTLADPSGRIIYHNPASLTLHGYSSLEEALLPQDQVMTEWDIRDLAGRPVPQEAWPMPRALRGETFDGYKLEVRRRDGEVHFTGSYSGGLVRDPHGQPLCAMLIVRDVTEQERARQALQESEERFRTVAEFTYDWEYWIGPDGKYLYVSPSCERITGYPAEAFRRDPHLVLSIVHPEDRERLAHHLEQPPENSQEHSMDFRIRTRKGEERWLNHVCQPVYGEDGAWLGRRGSHRDITLRRQVEESVRWQNRLLEGINRIFEQALSDGSDEDLGQACLAVAETLTGSQFGFVGEIGRDGLLHDVAVSETGWENCALVDQTGHRRASDSFEIHGLYGWVLREGKSLLVNDPASHPESTGVPEDHPPLEAFLGVPLIQGDETIGMIGVANREGGYREEDRVALETLAPAVVESFARKRAERALQRYAERLRALHEADHAILAAYSVEEIAQAALRRVPSLLDCVRVDVMLYDLDAGAMTLLAVHAAGETQVDVGWRSDIDEQWTIVVEDLAQGASYVIEDVQQAPSDSPWREALRREQVQTLVVVPLLVEGVLIGSLNLGTRELGQLSGEEREIVDELAIQLALGIHQARLRERVRRHAGELEDQVRRRTAALQASQARLQAIFDHAAVGIALVDLEGQVVDANPGFQQLLGYTAGELAGMPFTEFTHPAEVEEDEGLFRDLLAGERESYSLTRRFARRDDRTIWVNLVVSLVRDDQGRPQYGIGLIEDVTEKREAQQAVMQSEKLALTGRLAASLAHEINNPLQSVIGSLDLAHESLGDGQIDDASQMLQIGTEELQRAAGIVTQLRDLNRPSERGEKELTDVKQLVDHVLLLTRRQCHKGHVEVDWEPAADLPWISAVPDQIKQVFLNLVLNAVEAMHGGGQLSVRALGTAEPEGIRVAFSDTGPGIPAEAQPQLFDPFYTTKREGLGLGLYVTQNIIDAHGGRIEVESRMGEGTTFTVWLPAEGGGT